MTETNHSQTIPISPSVFPTKNKKMTEQPHYYKFDIDKIKSVFIQTPFGQFSLN